MFQASSDILRGSRGLLQFIAILKLKIFPFFSLAKGYLILDSFLYCFESKLSGKPQGSADRETTRKNRQKFLYFKARFPLFPLTTGFFFGDFDASEKNELKTEKKELNSIVPKVQNRRREKTTHRIESKPYGSAPKSQET